MRTPRLLIGYFGPYCRGTGRGQVGSSRKTTRTRERCLLPAGIVTDVRVYIRTFLLASKILRTTSNLHQFSDCVSWSCGLCFFLTSSDGPFFWVLDQLLGRP